ncbi:hypothetical protein C8J57DRAFT_1534643 [Mycena rebaudengoi]|nr:hypothetical protein C8J57DRAFT_1534643 [Mycena rebaudengoi]
MSPHSPLRTLGAVSLRIRPPLSPPPAVLERISLPQTLPVASLEDSTVRKCALHTEHTVPGASSSGRVRASLPFNHNRVLRAIDDLDGWGGWIGDDWRWNSMYEVPDRTRIQSKYGPQRRAEVLRLPPRTADTSRTLGATPFPRHAARSTLPYHITPPFELSPPKELRIPICFAAIYLQDPLFATPPNSDDTRFSKITREPFSRQGPVLLDVSAGTLIP